MGFKDPLGIKPRFDELAIDVAGEDKIILVLQDAEQMGIGGDHRVVKPGPQGFGGQHGPFLFLRALRVPQGFPKMVIPFFGKLGKDLLQGFMAHIVHPTGSRKTGGPAHYDFIRLFDPAGGLAQSGGVVLGSQESRMMGIGFHSLSISAHGFSPLSSDSNRIPFFPAKSKQKNRAGCFLP